MNTVYWNMSLVFIYHYIIYSSPFTIIQLLSKSLIIRFLSCSLVATQKIVSFMNIDLCHFINQSCHYTRRSICVNNLVIIWSSIHNTSFILTILIISGWHRPDSGSCHWGNKWLFNQNWGMMNSVPVFLNLRIGNILCKTENTTWL